MSSVSVCRANGGGSDRERLRLGGALAVERRRRHLAILDRKERLARLALEDVDVSGLRDLRDRVDRAPVARHRDERRRRGEVAVPEVVLHRLEMPDALARPRVEREQRVGEQVVADAVRAVEVERRRAGRGEDDRRAADRPSRRPTRSRRRRPSTRRAATSRSRTRPDAESCESSSAARRSSRRTRECRPATTAASRGTVLPMMSRSSNTTPGVLALTEMPLDRPAESFAQVDAAVCRRTSGSACRFSCRAPRVCCDR